MIPIDIVRAGPDFDAWPEVLRLLHEAFAWQTDRIDPPSSLHALDADALAAKARAETLLLAYADDTLTGCAFIRLLPDRAYLGKLAVHPDAQGTGIGRALAHAAEDCAKESGLALMELETRIELVENHRTFERLGYHKVAETAHAGYDRPTAITMHKPLLADADTRATPT